MLPAASFALAKLRMHLVYSGYAVCQTFLMIQKVLELTIVFDHLIFISVHFRYCYTARGGFCYSEEDIFEFHAGKEFFDFPFH